MLQPLLLAVLEVGRMKLRPQPGPGAAGGEEERERLL